MQYTNIVEDDAVTPTGGTSLITEHGMGCITSSDGTFILYADGDGIKKRILSSGVTTTAKSWASLSITTPTNNVFFCKNTLGIYCVHAPHNSYDIKLIRFYTSGTYASFVTSTTSPGVDGQFYVDLWVDPASKTPLLMYTVSGAIGVVNTSSAEVTLETDPTTYAIRCTGKFPAFIAYNGTSTNLYVFETSWFSYLISTENLIGGLTIAESDLYRGYYYKYSASFLSGFKILSPLLEDTTFKTRFINVPNASPLFVDTNKIDTINDNVIILPPLTDLNISDFGYAYDYTSKENMYVIHKLSWMPYLVSEFSASTYNTICPSTFGLLRASSTDFVLNREQITTIYAEGIVSNNYTLQCATRLQNYVYRFYNTADELISITKIVSSSYSNGIFTHNCVDLRLANYYYTYSNILQEQNNINFSDFSRYIFNYPANYCNSFSFKDPFSQNVYKTITKSQYEEILENTYNFYIVHHPDGQIEAESGGVDSGITLSYSNNNFYANTFVEGEKNEKPSRIIAFGSTTEVYVDKSSNNQSGIIMRISFPLINSVTELEKLVTNMLNSFASVYTVSLKAKMLLEEGMYLTLDVSSKSNIHPIIGSFNSTMYITSSAYDLAEECTNITMSSAMIFKSRISNIERLFQISDGLSSKFLQGSIYLPYFQATNYNAATSAWVKQACADNTVTALNLYNIVQNKGGFVWSSSARTKVYVPTSGWYLFQARVQFAGNTSGTRQARLRIDGVNADTHMLAAFLTQGSIDTIVNAIGMGWVDEGSYVECCGLQDTSPGVTLDMKYMAFNIVRLSL